jgi:hypothetical protein
VRTPDVPVHNVAGWHGTDGFMSPKASCAYRDPDGIETTSCGEGLQE